MGLYPRRVMLEAGLVDVGNELRGSVTRGGDPYREWLAVSLSRIRDLIDQTEGSPGAGDDQVNLQRDPDTFGTSRLMSATWGTLDERHCGQRPAQPGRLTGPTERAERPCRPRLRRIVAARRLVADRGTLADRTCVRGPSTSRQATRRSPR